VIQALAPQEGNPQRGEEIDRFLSQARRRLLDTFGFPSFRPGQDEALRAVAAGRDVLVVMPTGSGKSLCYQVPALILPGVTVVVSPLIALMKDQADALAMRGIAVTSINSSMGWEEQWERLRGLEEGRHRIVFVAPERWQSRAFRKALARIRVSLLAIDEAHCISHWGHDFRPDYRRLREVRSLLVRTPVIALTATATPEVREDIVRELEMRDPVRVLHGFSRPNLFLRAEKATGETQKRELLRRSVAAAVGRWGNGSLPAGIIYTATRRHAEEVAAFLGSIAWSAGSGEAPAGGGRGPQAVPCRAYHAGLDAQERRAVQEDFMEGRLPWVAATNAFGMGVDKSDTRFVVHYDLPSSLEAYYQEVGRGGRDGGAAECTLLFSEGDRRLQEFLIETSTPRRETIEAVYRMLLGLGENPVFRTPGELESIFLATEGRSAAHPAAVRSALSILERAGAIERLEHHDRLAEVSPADPSQWPGALTAKAGSFLRRLQEALSSVFLRSEGEAAGISIERWAADLETDEETLHRGLAEMSAAGEILYIPPFRGRAIRIADSPRTVEESGVDFTLLEERRRRDRERLAEVFRFARSRACRRDAILRHFGEEVPPGGCRHCDSCLCAGGAAEAGVPRPLEETERTIVRKLLSGVARARGRCGRSRLIQMLKGSRSGSLADLGLDRLSTFGILAEERQERLRELFDLLEDSGCLDRSDERYPVIRLTAKGWRVMTGEEAPLLPLPPRRARSPVLERPEPAGGLPGDASGEVERYDREVFEKLRRLRRQIADELRLPAFRIFNDRTLRVMARDLPVDSRSFRQVPGVGDVTFERFGERFLGLLREQSAGGRRRSGTALPRDPAE